MVREAKFVVEVKKAEKALRIEKEVSEIIKSVGGKFLNRKEYVECPLKGEKVPFPRCFVCTSFIRRIKGYVHCSGEEYSIKT